MSLGCPLPEGWAQKTFLAYPWLFAKGGGGRERKGGRGKAKVMCSVAPALLRLIISCISCFSVYREGVTTLQSKRHYCLQPERWHNLSAGVLEPLG